jgi:hypothetical protein
MREVEEDPAMVMPEAVEDQIEAQEEDETSIAWKELFSAFVNAADEANQPLEQTAISGQLTIGNIEFNIRVDIKPYFCFEEGVSELIILDLYDIEHPGELSPGQCVALASWEDGVPEIIASDGNIAEINGRQIRVRDVVISATKIVNSAAIKIARDSIPDGAIFPYALDITSPQHPN